MRTIYWNVLCGACLLGLVLVVSCSRDSSPGPLVLATVGEQTITSEDFLREVARREQARRPIPSKEELLREMVAYESLLQRARQSRLPEDPDVRREINNLLIGRLKERELSARLERVAVSEEEIQAAYEAGLDRYTQPAKVRLALLHLQADSKMSEARQQELARRMEEARAKFLSRTPPDPRESPGRGFGSLALEYSDDQASRYRGGDIGWLDAGRFDYRWPRQVLEAGQSLAPGDVSPILSLDSGWYLVMKTDERPGTITPLDQVRTALTQKLTLEKQHQVRAAFQEESVGLAGARMNLEALAEVPLPPSRARMVRNHIPDGPPSLPSVGASGGRETAGDRLPTY